MTVRYSGTTRSQILSRSVSSRVYPVTRSQARFTQVNRPSRSCA